jgi:hypothetical protein
MYPLPSPSHANYPFHTAGGGDKRWLGSGEVEEEGLQWVGGLLLSQIFHYLFRTTERIP